MPHKRLTMTLKEFLSEQIGEETVDPDRWKKVHELFPQEFRDIQYWGDMMHWLMKGLTPEGEKHYSDVLNDLLRFQVHKDWMKQHFEKFRDCTYGLPEKTVSDKENEQEKGKSAEVTEENLKYKRCENMHLGPWDNAAHAQESKMWVTPWDNPPVQEIPEKEKSESEKNKKSTGEEAAGKESNGEEAAGKESTGEEVSEEEQAKYTKAPDGEVTMLKEEEKKKEPPSGSLRRMPSVLVASIFV